MEILIVDDHLLLLESLRACLESAMPEANFDICRSGEQARERLAQEPTPDLAIIDFYIPGIQGVSSFREIIKEFPATRIAIISGRVTRKEILQCLELGIAGFIIKDISVDEMCNAVRLMADGGMYLPPKLFLDASGKERMLPSGVRLTNREYEVLTLIHDGCSNKQIANLLSIAEITAKMHASRLLRKYEVKNRVELTNSSREDLLFQSPQ